MVSPPPNEDAPPPGSVPAKSEENSLGLPGMVLAAIGGSIGVLSFVAFFGGAILWVRMDEAGLPGSEAVALIPRSVLLATGANFLVPSLLIALGFTAVLYLIETWTINQSTSSLHELEENLGIKEQEAEARYEEAEEASQKAERMSERAAQLRKRPSSWHKRPVSIRTSWPRPGRKRRRSPPTRRH